MMLLIALAIIAYFACSVLLSLYVGEIVYRMSHDKDETR